MENGRRIVLGIGELLWDVLPDGAHLGGAPANFCYIAAVLGASAIPVSCVGDDELGAVALRTLEEHGLDTSAIQRDSKHPTGTVDVTLGAQGSPSYSIRENVAWDNIAWSPIVAELAGRADAVCFGTLAQRSATSFRTIRRILGQVSTDCLRIFDVNLRPPYYSAGLVRDSIAVANVLKLNHEELPFILSACRLPNLPEEEGANVLREYGSLRTVCITRGANGSVLCTAEGTVVHPGIRVAVADTVGAGDAFTAALALQLLEHRPLNESSDFANRVASLVASRSGAMPVFSATDRDLLFS